MAGTGGAGVVTCAGELVKVMVFAFTVVTDVG